MSDALACSKRLVLRVVLLQAGCAVIAASVFLVFKGASAGLAALVGGLIVAASRNGAVLGFGGRIAAGSAGGATLTTGDVRPEWR